MAGCADVADGGGAAAGGVACCNLYVSHYSIICILSLCISAQHLFLRDV